VFLATTRLSEFWKTDEEILFLGAWCLRHDRQKEWEGLKYQVLPSPWDDRKRFYDACAYLDESYERLLGHLCEYLNAVHGVSFSLRYWRILIGPWLLHSLHVAYDRYICLLEAFHSDPNLQTIVMDTQSFRVPGTAMESRNWGICDPFNLQIISQLLSAMGYVFPSHSFPDGWEKSGTHVGQRLSRRIAKGVISVLWETISRVKSTDDQIALCYMYWPLHQVLELVWQTRFQAVPYEGKTDWSLTLPEPVFDERRSGLARIPSGDEFEKAFIRSLPQNFPVVYLEGFQGVREKILEKARTFPPVIVSAVGWWFISEPFKFMAAEASQRGSRLVTVQHGGGYGISRYHPCEEHESRIADSYMVWGWAGQESQSIRNLPNPKLSSLLLEHSAHRDRNKNTTILFVATDCPRSLHRFQSNPTGNQWINYIDWERRFLEAVPADLRSAMLFRPHKNGADVIKGELTPKFPEIGWDAGGTFYQRLRTSRLLVIDHPGTTPLEAFAANIPTILFWDPQRWEMRQEVEPQMENLRKEGVLHDSPEAAAAKVAEIYHDPWIWWGSSEVQRARRDFADRFALARKDWVDHWANALAEELSLSRKGS
jgi:putative transferase (TIGR04331 family)